MKDISHYLIKMEIIVFTPNLEIVYQEGLFFLNYIIEQVIEITAQIKFNLLLNNFFFLFIIGAVIGSFLNVCIYRLPKNLDIASKRSFCPRCKKKLNGLIIFL